MNLDICTQEQTPPTSRTTEQKLGTTQTKIPSKHSNSQTKPITFKILKSRLIRKPAKGRRPTTTTYTQTRINQTRNPSKPSHSQTKSLPHKIRKSRLINEPVKKPMTHSTTETKTRSQPKPRIHQIIATVRQTQLNTKYGKRSLTNDPHIGRSPPTPAGAWQRQAT